MLKVPAFCFFFLLAASLEAQFGFQLSYDRLNQPEWRDQWNQDYQDNQNALYPSGWGVSGFYWLKFLDKRIEFLPQVGYGQSGRDLSGGNGEDSRMKSARISFEVQASVYPLDLEGDCNCPTFSKRGSLIKKGFHLFALAGYHLWNHEVASPNFSWKETDGRFSAGLGAGLDIGVSDLLTLTPYLSASFLPGMEWKSAYNREVFGMPAELAAPAGNAWLMRGGLRMTLRVDKKRW